MADFKYYPDRSPIEQDIKSRLHRCVCECYDFSHRGFFRKKECDICQCPKYQWIGDVKNG